MRLFGQRGFSATTIRAIADAADVSPALVVHHFGSKQGLRDAVEEFLVADIRAGKFAAMTGAMTPSGAEYEQLARAMAPEMDYLARALTDDSGVGRHLYERLHADAVEYLGAGVRAGILQPTDDLRAQAAVLLNAGLAQMLLGAHTRRVLGTDDDIAMMLRIAPVMLDLYTDGLFTDDRFRAAWHADTETDHETRTADPDPPATGDRSRPDHAS